MRERFGTVLALVIFAVLPTNLLGAEPQSDGKLAFLRDEAQIATEQFSANSDRADAAAKEAKAAFDAGHLVEGCGRMEFQVTESLKAEDWAHQIIDLSIRIGEPDPGSPNMLKRLDEADATLVAAYKQQCAPLSGVDPKGQINAEFSLSGRVRLIQALFDQALNRLEATEIEAKATDYKRDGMCIDTAMANRRLDAALLEIAEFEAFAKPAGVDTKDVIALRKNAIQAKELGASLTKGHCTSS